MTIDEIKGIEKLNDYEKKLLQGFLIHYQKERHITIDEAAVYLAEETTFIHRLSDIDENGDMMGETVAIIVKDRTTKKTLKNVKYKNAPISFPIFMRSLYLVCKIGEEIRGVSVYDPEDDGTKALVRIHDPNL